MIIVFPVSKVDVHLALPLAKWMRKLGPYPRHEALIVWSPEVPPEQREPIAVEFRAMGWKSPAKATTATVTTQEWPVAPNEIFRHAAMMVGNDPSLQRPWFFMEADCTPMRSGWADALADEYNRESFKPFLGCIDNTYARASTGQIIKVGQHLVGTAIYPAYLIHHTRAHIGCVEAFDMALSKEIMPAARHTDMIQHNWSTGNYRRHDGQIVCDTVKLRFTQEGNPLNRPVKPDTLVLHGCKDLSLLTLLDSQCVQTVAFAEPPKPVEQPKTRRRQRSTL